MQYTKPKLSVQVNQALKVSGATDAYIELVAEEFALVAEFKEDAKSIKQPRVLAQLAVASASSKYPVMALVTDLKDVHELYWIESNSQDIREVNRMPLLDLTSTLFFFAIRAFLAASLAALHSPVALQLEPCDSGFESNYNREQPDGDRDARTHRCKVTLADSSKLQKDGADRSAEGGSPRDGDVWYLPGPQEWLTAEEWEEVGAMYEEKATIIANVFLKYENMTPRQVHLKVAQEQEEEELELRRRADDHEALRSTRLALMAA